MKCLVTCTGLWVVVCLYFSNTLSMKRNSRPVEFYRLCFNTWKINFSCLTQEIWCFTLCVPQFDDNKERLTSTVSNFTHKAILTNKSGLYEWETLTWWISVNPSESESGHSFIKTLIWFTSFPTDTIIRTFTRQPYFSPLLWKINIKCVKYSVKVTSLFFFFYLV